ncbi:PAS domain S-box protein [Methylobacterium sp. J-090]|uniref:PAS domain S-box protein n=1 Tax=Methylobacterium sp. J-090 TaxID=2836666 RepID=UPI001FB9B8FF|nr:PAS domain S-box protein [Methylobacterium sp. J-090]MCJ2081446.1 PAS domain S-box protein [Methylobacterium sp. J-090]
MTTNCAPAEPVAIDPTTILDSSGRTAPGATEVEDLRARLRALEAEVARMRETEAARMREALLGHRAEDLRLLTDALPALVAQIGRDYRYRFNNRHYETWFGRRPEGLVGAHVRDVIGAAAFDERRPFMDRALAGEHVRVEGFLPDGSGRRRPCTIAYIPRRNEADAVDGFIVTVVDLGEGRAAESRRLALADLGDRLRDLDDTAQMAFVAAEILGRTIGVSRAGYGTIDPATETITIERDWNAPGITSLAGTLRFRDYGSYIEDLKRGETVVCVDAETDPRTAATAPALKAISAQSFVNMPLTEHGGFVALLYLNHATARAWPAEELAFVRLVAERVRAATERVRSEAARRASEAQFRAFAQAVPNHVWAASADGRLDWFNAQVYAYSGAGPNDLDGAAWGTIVHPDDRGGVVETWGAALAEGTPYETSFRIRRADGAYRWFLVRAEPIRAADGVIVRWVGTNTDIDDQRAAAAELTRLNALLAEQVEHRTRERDRIWDTTTDLMGTAGLDGYLKSVNPAWSRTLGWSESELLAQPFTVLIDPADHAETGDVVRRLARGEAVTGFVDRIACKDGRQRVVMWTAAPGGDVFYIVGRDITEQRQTEEALRQAQKMEAVGQLTGGLAHDFNNLLTGISGSLELLQTRMSQGRLTDLDRYINAAQGASKRAAALTHRLLAFSRRQTLDPKPTNINGLIAGMEELIRRTVGPAITIEVVGTAGLWTALIDPNQLENALLNLCINARDAMPTGGRITIETANKWMDTRAAKERDLEPGQYLSLCVTDTGTGMPPEVAARAFDPFFTTKPMGEGTGLGLSMIYGFVRQSGGQVRIYSEVGDGTTLCLYLPRHYGAAETAELPADLADAPRAEQGQTVLIVDDEPTVRMLVTEVLEDLGYTAIEAADGAAGLKVLQSDVRLDLLVTDVGLPGGMNGRQMADAGRAVRPGLKVLFITGYAENAVLGNGTLSPDMQVLTKPFVMEALAVRIRDLIAGG